MEMKRLNQLIDKLPRIKRLFNGNFDVTSINATGAAAIDGFAIIYIEQPPQRIGHYVMIYSFGKQLKFFDSFGQRPSTYGIKLHCPYNSIQLQSYNSCLCAGFIIYCVNASINRGVPIEMVIKTDFKDPRYNDCLIHQWLSKLGIRDLLRCQ